MGAEAIITMVQDRELDLLSVRDISEKCGERGLTWLHCPIPDGGRAAPSCAGRAARSQ